MDPHQTAIEHKINMAGQKFAHDATHCNFKRTALSENSLHYDNKTTKQILCRFQKICIFNFFKDHKIVTHLLFSDVLRLIR